MTDSVTDLGNRACG